MYDGRADPIGHISHFRQSMALHLGNDALICRMFPSSLGPMSLRWFNCLQHSSIHSWDELAEAFVSRFITNSRKPKEFDSLMSMRMKDSESLKSYSLRYWEVYNEVDGGTEEMAIKTFKLGLNPKSELRHNLSKRLAKSMRDLMSRIEQYVQVEDDRVRTRAVSTQSQLPRKLAIMEPRKAEPPPKNPTCFPRPKELDRVYTVFNEPIYRIMAEIKNESFFSWPTPLGGDSSKRDPNKYCSYHKEKGHMTEKCYSLKQHLEELARAGHLRRYLKDFPKVLSFLQIGPQPIVWLPIWPRCVDRFYDPSSRLGIVDSCWSFMVMLSLAITYVAAQVSGFSQFFQVLFQRVTSLGHMALLSVIRTVYEEWFIFYLAYDAIDWFVKNRIYSAQFFRSWKTGRIPWG